MPYFKDLHDQVKCFVPPDGGRGLRNAQLGAIFAIASHFTVKRDPALVVMPTGAGKTAVLMLVPFFRRSNRALIVTPSKLVRSQVASDFSDLSVLKYIGVISNDAPGPKVHELRGRIHTGADWDDLRQFDVIVATPNSISPEYEGIPTPPSDLFDVLLIDEAHHSPARTWRKILECFPTSDTVLFTATPYRHDSREIKGRFVYDYPVKAAFEEKIFGKVRFHAAETKPGETADLAIALLTESIFQQDKDAGLNHRVMVRTSQIKRATELAKLYAEHTSLRLRAVNSNHTYATVKRTLEQLRNGELDGVICVDMMSEGFDFPWLKIAAVHAPHKSLAVTLQFIGRFARTNAPDIGEAKFVAVPQEIRGEVQALYVEGAVWQDIILDLQHGKIEEEKEVREAIETFAAPITSDANTNDLSLYSLWPYSHVKVFHVERENVDIATTIRLPRPFQVIFQTVSADISTAVIVTNETEQPKWSDLQVFSRSEYDLFVIHFDATHRLLFINASRKSESLYDEIARQYTLGAHKNLPLYVINRVLHGMSKAEFFNVGMKNRIAYANAETYRILAGPRADKAVGASDGRLFHCGHLFGKGQFKNEPTTIGLSSASKIWSNQNLQIPNLVAWCKELARRFAIEGPLPKLEGLQYLPLGEKLVNFPEGIMMALWPDSVYRHHVDILFRNGEGREVRLPISEAELLLDRPSCNATQICFRLLLDGFEFPIRFRLDGNRFFECMDNTFAEPKVIRKAESHGLLAYINGDPVTFLTVDYSIIRGDEVIRFASSDFQPFEAAGIKVVPWETHGVDITREFALKKGKGSAISIHEFLFKHLDSSDYLAVLYDHRVGEAADFITFSENDGRVVIGLYHCKGSGGPKAGDRVEDLYEVCGQGVKCLLWIENEPDLLEHIRKRAASGSQFVRGSFKAIKAAMESGTRTGFVYQVFLVQPGVSKSALSKKSGELLAATRDYLIRSGVRDCFVMGSQ